MISLKLKAIDTPPSQVLNVTSPDQLIGPPNLLLTPTIWIVYTQYGLYTQYLDLTTCNICTYVINQRYVIIYRAAKIIVKIVAKFAARRLTIEGNFL